MQKEERLNLANSCESEEGAASHALGLRPRQMAVDSGQAGQDVPLYFSYPVVNTLIA